MQISTKESFVIHLISEIEINYPKKIEDKKEKEEEIKGREKGKKKA